MTGDDGQEALRLLLKKVGAGEAAGLSDPAAVRKLLAGLEERIRVIRNSGFGDLHAATLVNLAEARDQLAERLAIVEGAAGDGQDYAAVRTRVAGIDARIAALQAEVFSQENVTRIARLIEERGVLVLRTGRPMETEDNGGPRQNGEQ